MTGGAGTSGGTVTSGGTRQSGRLRRTRLLTAASVVVVVLAGAAAVGANVGILGSAAETPTGKLSAAGELTGEAGATTAGGSPSAASSMVVAGGGVRQFAVDSAGTVTVSGSVAGLRLESVAPASGWRWSAAQSSASVLMITFTDGVRTLEFVASAAPDGSVSATVTEPGSSATGSPGRATAGPAPVASAVAAGPTASTSDDDDEGGDDRSKSVRSGSSGSSGSGSGRFEGGDDDD